MTHHIERQARSAFYSGKRFTDCPYTHEAFAMRWREEFLRLELEREREETSCLTY